MKRHTIYLCILLLGAVWGATQLHASVVPEKDTVDIKSRTAIRLLPDQRLGAGQYELNPAAQLYRYRSSLSITSGHFLYERMDRAVYPQEGEGANDGTFRFDSYLRLGSRALAFGRIDYTQGLVRNQRWNTTSDFCLLAPYFSGDNVGGDMKHECYSFAGGYARRDGGISYGLQVAYRALLEYDELDPRPCNITSHFTLGGGAGFRLGRYLVHGAIGGADYFQRSLLHVTYDAVAPALYTFTGINTVWGQSNSSAEARNRDYEGKRFYVQIGILPQYGSDGWLVHAGYNYWKMNTMLHWHSGAAAIGLALSKIHRTDASVAYRHHTETGGVWAIETSGAYEMQQGFEGILPKLGYIYPAKGYMPQYLRHTTQGSLRGSMGREFDKCAFFFSPRTEFYRTTESHSYPNSSQSFCNMATGAELTGAWLGSRWMLHVSLDIMQHWNVNKALTLGSNKQTKTIAPWIDEMATGIHERLTTSHTDSRASLRADYGLTSYLSLFLSAGYRLAHYGVNDTARSLELTAGINF